jgi:hypothetical protein
MRLKYNILWIENDKAWQSTAQKLIESELIDLGFVPVIQKITSAQDLEELLIFQPFLKEYDIILVDYKLNNNERGNILIDRIRQNEIFTDVIFYSQDINALRDTFRSLELEGVYTSSRVDFEDRFSKIMKTTIKKVEEVSTMRGLIMAETAELDEKMLSIIQKYLDNHPENKRNEFADYLFQKVDSSLSMNRKKFGEHKDKNNIKDLIETLLFTSFQKSLGINKIIKDSEKDSIKKHKGFHNLFEQKIIKIRNIFAHVVEKVENDKSVLINTKGEREIFSSDRCIEIRKDILEFSNKLKEIEDNI